jgi:hypothetical protein
LSNHDFSSSPPLLLPDTINKLVSLTIISSSLSSAPLQSLLSSSPHFLRVLDVTNNALSSVPDLSSAKKLLSLNLSHNPISASPASPCLPPFPQTLAMCLRCLDLENCGLNSIVDGLAPLKQLRSLNIACNELTTDEMKRVQAAPFSSRLEEFSLHPMPSLTACPDYKEVMSLLLKKMSCLKALDGLPFSQQVAVDIDKLASLDLHSGDDDNVKDSSSCSCVEGNACISRCVLHREPGCARANTPTNALSQVQLLAPHMAQEVRGGQARPGGRGGVPSREVLNGGAVVDMWTSPNPTQPASPSEGNLLRAHSNHLACPLPPQ